MSETTDGPNLSPGWFEAVRDPSGMMAAAEPIRLELSDWSRIGAVFAMIMDATFDEATVWTAEMSITINPPPQAGTPLDFIEVDVDGRFPWHASNATFMAPSGDVSRESNEALTSQGWKGVGTGGPVYKIWDDVALDAVANEIVDAALSVFPPTRVGWWEIGVTVLDAADAAGTDYEVVASATRAVLQRTVLTALADNRHSDDGSWEQACRHLGLRLEDVPVVHACATP